MAVTIREAIIQEKKLTHEEYALHLLDKIDQRLYQLEHIDIVDLMEIDNAIEGTLDVLNGILDKIKLHKRMLK